MRVAVVTDNDGDTQKAIDRFADYSACPTISIHVSKSEDGFTLEPQLVSANGIGAINAILGTALDDADDLSSYMKSRKVDVALKLFEHAGEVKMPEYLLDAIAK